MFDCLDEQEKLVFGHALDKIISTMTAREE
jgi:hypothetical protein